MSDDEIAAAHYHLRVHGTNAIFFFFQAEDGIRVVAVTGVQTCALPILLKTIARSRSLLRAMWLGSVTASS